MPLIAAIFGLLFPRIMLAILYFTTDWFNRIDNLWLGLLGFIFLPVSLLWYLAVMNYFGGLWTTMPIVGMVIAVVIDLGLWKKSKKE